MLGTAGAAGLQSQQASAINATEGQSVPLMREHSTRHHHARPGKETTMNQNDTATIHTLTARHRNECSSTS